MKKNVKYDYLHVLCICQGTQVAALGGKVGKGWGDCRAFDIIFDFVENVCFC